MEERKEELSDPELIVKCDYHVNRNGPAVDTEAKLLIIETIAIGPVTLYDMV